MLDWRNLKKAYIDWIKLVSPVKAAFRQQNMPQIQRPFIVFNVESIDTDQGATGIQSGPDEAGTTTIYFEQNFLVSIDFLGASNNETQGDLSNILCTLWQPNVLQVFEDFGIVIRGWRPVKDIAFVENPVGSGGHWVDRSISFIECAVGYEHTFNSNITTIEHVIGELEAQNQAIVITKDFSVDKEES